MRTILVSAYACEPLKGSEQGVGWNWVLQMAKKNRLHVITRANNQTSIEAHLPIEIAGNITFHYYDTHKFILKLKNRAKGLYLYYFCWQLGIIPLIWKLIKEHSFDYSMHLTFGSIWLPTFLPLFKVPFIWGPVGGGEGVPRTFLSLLKWDQRLIQAFRICLKYISNINPIIYFNSAKSVGIIARTSNTAEYIPSKYRSKIKVFLETSMDSLTLQSKRFNIENECIRLIITGRLVPFKNVITAIRSLTYISINYKYCLTIIGSGSEKEKILAELAKNHLAHKVDLVDEMPRSNLINELSKSDIFVFPSLREGGSWSLMEAMAIGLPVICMKWSGMEVITDDASAIRLPVTNPEQMAKDLADAICHLIDHPELRMSMGEAGRKRIKDLFSWEAKGEFMESLMDELDQKK